MNTKLDIQTRVERFALLRSALRAVEASGRDADSFGLEASFQQVRGWIVELRSASEATGGSSEPSSSELALSDNLDRMLDELQRAIVEQIRAIPLSQLRATLPAIRRQQPEKLEALLDLCLVADAGSSTWWQLVDYLLTLLVHEEEGGRRFVARDPTRVTARLAELCAISDREKNTATDALAQMFDDARLGLERGDPAGPIIDRMRTAKHQAMETLLIPNLLRAIIAYNVAASNQRAEMIETQHTLDDQELLAFEQTLGTRGPDKAAEPASIEPSSQGALESAVLREVAGAVGSGLRRAAPGSGPAWELAAALDLSKLSPYEAAALRDPEAHPAANLVAIAVLLRLIGKGAGRLEDPLARVGISAEQVQTEWIPELEERLRSESAELLAGGAYDDARRVAEIRTRLLRKPDDDFNAWRLEREPETVESPSSACEIPPAPAPKKAKPRATAPARRGTTKWPTIAACAAVVGVLTVGANAYFSWDVDPRVSIFSEHELAELSIYVESGYRNGKGVGPAFVGTLRSNWHGLNADEREVAGRAIEEKLRAQGISEFMFFDGRRELMLRYRDGQLSVH